MPRSQPRHPASAPTRGTPVLGTISFTVVLLAAAAGCDSTTAPDGSDVIVREPALTGRLVAGSSHTCKLATDDAAYCWGSNGQGQVGIGALSPRVRQPTAVATTLRFARLAAGYSHTCGLTRDGTAYCWGWNGRGELGDGTTQTRTVPTPVATSLRFTTLVTGAGIVTCGLTADSQAYCWGSNFDGTVGDGTTVDRVVPTAVATPSPLRLLTVGYASCGLAASGQAYCWGDNTFGALGVGDTRDRSVPGPVQGGVSFAALAAGGYAVCGLTAAGVPYCWGRTFAQGTASDAVTTPTPLAGNLQFASLAAGSAHACGLTPRGRAYCWGDNLTGALGDGTTERVRPAPTPVTGGLAFQLVVAGDSHTCGLTSSASLYCWGFNTTGQLGDSTTASRNRPVLIHVP